jgi:H+/Cl- antiporter ClcA
MHLDVRVPLGWLFLILGIILAAYGLTVSQRLDPAPSLLHNIDLVWGLVFAAFGGVVLAIAGRKKS